MGRALRREATRNALLLLARGFPSTDQDYLFLTCEQSLAEILPLYEDFFTHSKLEEHFIYATPTDHTLHAALRGGGGPGVRRTHAPGSESRQYFYHAKWLGLRPLYHCCQRRNRCLRRTLRRGLDGVQSLSDEPGEYPAAPQSPERPDLQHHAAG